jgi:hypothetical protein
MVRKNRQYLREKSMVATVVRYKHFLGGRLVLVKVLPLLRYLLHVAKIQSDKMK